MPKTTEQDKLTRSIKLKKYESVYKSYIKQTEQLKKSPRRSRYTDKKSYKDQNKKSQSREDNKNSKKDQYRKDKKDTKDKKNKKDKKDDNKKHKKILNPYQQFVKTESKKKKYTNLLGKERFPAIAEEWKKIKNA